MKIQTLICSSDKYFLECFSSYMVGKSDVDFDVTFFTDFQSAVQHMNYRRIDVFITDFALAGEIQLPDNVVGLCISDRTKVSVQGRWHELNIYQRGVDILGDIQKIMSALHGKDAAGEGRKQKLISFSSMQGGSGKTTIAYLTAKLCAHETTSLYLNIEDFGYTDHLYRTDFDTSMEEVMFALKDDRDVAAYVSNAINKNSDNVAVLPMIKNYGDFQSLSDKNVIDLIRALTEVSDAEYICIDLADGFSRRNEKIMEMCDYNFVVINDDVVGNGKLERLRKDQSMLAKPYYKELYFIINKSVKKEDDGCFIRIPFSESLSKGVGLEQVLAGNQDFHRSCLGIVSLISK